MSIYFRILKFVKPYKFVVLISLISSFLFVLMNAFSLWMISTLISTIMLQDNKAESKLVIDEGIYHKLENFAENLIGINYDIVNYKFNN